MADQYEVVTRLLQTNGLADWHVVEPLSGDVRDYVWIQRADANRDMYVSISRQDVDDLPDEELLKRIRRAMGNPSQTVEERKRNALNSKATLVRPLKAPD